MDDHKQVDAAFFEFKKAFDRVHNDVLLRKLSAVGFAPKLLRLFASYMSNRTQYVQLGNCRSHNYIARSGVSQGSTLGPTQFLIMVNDLPQVIKNAKCLMYADDLKLYMGIGCEADCEVLQKDVDALTEWSKHNLLDFNVAKCKIITFTRKQEPICYPYNISGTSLERVTQMRDLGLTLDVELTFNTHIVEMCKHASKTLGFVMRQTSRFRDRHTIVMLYYSFVRSALEYNCIIWSPHEKKYKLMIEQVQKKFARYLYKRLYGFYPFLYPSLFVGGMVGIHTLELRRGCALSLHYYLLLNGDIDNPDTLSRCNLYTPERACRQFMAIRESGKGVQYSHYTTVLLRLREVGAEE
ncbi:reverse transcriptase (RNA-dependent DNA polymerase) domain-containing protein [Phthorimaea operculella]|nr:reverse transcriptase (RNA-dependent DNA polymerase) domain-containing protein [Phthorimaea operculella]